MYIGERGAVVVFAKRLDRMGESHWDSLVGEIYQAALDPERWPDLLMQLGRPINAHAGQLVVLADDVSATFDNLLVGLDVSAATVEFEELVKEGLHERANHILRVAELTTFVDYMHTSKSRMRRSTFYEEHAKKHDIPYYGASVVSKSSDTLVAFALLRSQQAGHLDDDEVAYIDRLAPHVKRSLALSMRLRPGGFADGAASVVENLACAAFVIDHRLRVRSANSAARKLLGAGDGIYETGGQLRLSDKTANARLRGELAASLGGHRATRVSGTGRIIAQRSSDKLPYILFATPIGDTVRSVFSSPLCVLMIVDPLRQLSVPEELLGTVFGLTCAETQVVALLAGGQSPREIAEQRGTSLSTVRTQLKAIYKKTNTSHQSELVSKTLALSTTSASTN